jgi:hypothetical protein
MCVLHAGGQRASAAGERAGDLHRRRLPSEHGTQPGDPPAARGGRPGIAPARVELLKRKQEQLSAQDATISGWNVGLNSGEAAGQTVFHAHWHLIPRREGDCEEPVGGVRGVIADRMSYG